MELKNPKSTNQNMDKTKIDSIEEQANEKGSSQSESFATEKSDSEWGESQTEMKAKSTTLRKNMKMKKSQTAT